VSSPVDAGTPVSCPSTTAVATTTDSLTRVYDMSEVTRPINPVVRNERTQPPAEEILRLGQPQRALVRFVVDTAGLVEPCSIVLLETTHPLWGEAVLGQLPGQRYHPALRGSRVVRMTVDMPFNLTVLSRPPEKP